MDSAKAEWLQGESIYLAVIPAVIPAPYMPAQCALQLINHGQEPEVFIVEALLLVKCHIVHEQSIGKTYGVTAR